MIKSRKKNINLKNLLKNTNKKRSTKSYRKKNQRRMKLQANFSFKNHLK
jgi:hypothetical protein